MSTTLLDVAAVRARFSALDGRLAFFDGPGGTQCPDEVIDAIASLLARGQRQHRRAVRDEPPDGRARRPRPRARRPPSSAARRERSRSGQSMTALNFLLTRAFGADAARGRRGRRDALDHDGNVSPWLELRPRPRDRRPVRRASRGELEVDYDDLERQALRADTGRRLPGRRELGRHGAGRPPHRRRSPTAPVRSRGPTRSTTGRTGRSTSPSGTSTCSSARRTSSSGRTWGSHSARATSSSRGGRTRCGPAANEPVGHRFELGTSQHELLAGFVAAVDYVDSLGWDAIVAHERELGERFLDGLPETVELYGLRTMEGRVPTFCFNVPGMRPEEAATALAERDVAVWHGDYYAVETMQHLGLDGRGSARRHRPLQHRGGGRPAPRRPRRARMRLLRPRRHRSSSGRALVDAALARGHEVTLFNRGRTNPGPVSRARAPRRRPRGRPRALEGRTFDAVVDTSGYLPRRRRSLVRRARRRRPVLLRLERLRLRRPERPIDEESALADARRALGRRGHGARPTARSRRSARKPPSRPSTDARSSFAPGSSSGPHDPTGRFTYWPHRVARGGEVLAPGAGREPDPGRSTCATSARGSSRSASGARVACTTRRIPDSRGRTPGGVRGSRRHGEPDHLGAVSISRRAGSRRVDGAPALDRGSCIRRRASRGRRACPRRGARAAAARRDRARAPSKTPRRATASVSRPSANRSSSRRGMAAGKDYSGTPLSQKLGAKPGAGVVVYFTSSRDELERRFEGLKATLDPADGLWIAWPKSSAKLEGDLTFEPSRRSGSRTGSSTTSRARSSSAVSAVEAGSLHVLRDRSAQVERNRFGRHDHS